MSRVILGNLIYYLLSIIYSPCAPTVLTRKAARTAAAATLGSGDAASILGILGSCGRCWSCKQRGHNLWLQRCLHLWVTVQERGSICTVPAAASISLMSHLHTTSAPEQPLVASVCSSVGTVPSPVLPPPLPLHLQSRKQQNVGKASFSPPPVPVSHGLRWCVSR